MGEIRLERNDSVATVTLSNAGKLNAMSRDMWLEFGELWQQLNTDDSVRCVVVTGAGKRGFCPGNDISEFETYRADAAKARELSSVMNVGREAMLACPHPVIARIRGACVGGGLEIAAMCDLRICTTDSRFGAPLNRLGLTMAYEEMLPIWRLTNRSTMFEFLVEGRIVDAATAETRGLVNRVVDPEDLDATVANTVTSIVDGPPLVNRWHKQFLRRISFEPALTQADYDEHYLSFETEDYRSGYRAFLAKEKPEFVGR